MKHRMSAIASVVIVMVVLAAVPAGAGTVPDQLDPHVDVTDVVFSQDTDGITWVDLALAGPWRDGSWVDQVFSAFISVDVANADDSSGLIVQHHDGAWTVAATYDVGGTTAETEPSLFILDSGGIRLNLGSLTADDMFFLVQSASMKTTDSPRIEGTQFAGSFNWSKPDFDPGLGAIAEFNLPLGAFPAIKNPLLSSTGEPAPAVASTDQSADQPTTAPTQTTPPADLASPAVPLSDDDSQALADDLDARAQDDLPASNDDEGDSNAARNFLIIAVLVAFSVALGRMLLRRSRGQVPPGGGDKPIDHLSNEIPSDDEIRAKIDAANKDLLEKYELNSDAAPEETPPDLPDDLPDETPIEPPEDPDDFIDRVL